MIHQFDAIVLSDHQPEPLYKPAPSFYSPSRGKNNMKTKGPCALVKEAVSKLQGG
jgi:hypothetical protein